MTMTDEERCVSNAFSSAAATYSEYATPQRFWGDHLCQSLSGLLFSPSRILDLGCGDGSFTKRVSALFPGASILGIDSSMAMLEKARSLGISNATFDYGSFMGDIEFSNYDLIVSNASLQWASSFGELLSKMTAGLSSESAIIISVFTKESFVQLRSALDSVFDSEVPLAVDGFLSKKESVEKVSSFVELNYEFKELSYTEVFDSASDLLSSLKLTGVTGVGGSNGLWTPRRLNALDRELAAQGYALTYEGLLISISSKGVLDV